MTAKKSENHEVGESTDTEGRHAPLRDSELERTLDNIVEQGRPRLFRTTSELLASGTIAGVEVGFGVLAFLTVEQATGSKLLAGLAFSIGFVALLLGNSELFTEGFLVPLTVVAAREASWLRLLRFWLLTLIGNVVGGWVIMWMVMTAFPGLHKEAVTNGGTFATAPLTLQTFLLAVIGGSAITLLTRMRNGTENDVVKVIACVIVGFLIAGLGMFHSILDTLFVFAGIQVGASYGYGQWIVWFGWVVLGNLLGGVGLTGFLRLVRTHERLFEWRRTTAPSPEGAAR